MGQYKHLTIEERENIFEMKIKDCSTRKIATVLNRNASTISRELRRNTKANSLYSPSQATENYRKKRKKCKEYYRTSCEDIQGHYISLGCNE